MSQKKTISRIGIEPISSKFISAVSWTTLASIVARTCGVIVAILMARSLGSSALGLYAIVLSTLGLFSTFISSGLSLTGCKVVAEHYINNPEKAGRTIGLLLITLMITILFGVGIYWWFLPFISNKVYRIPELLPLLKLSIIWLVLMSINQLFESVLTGLQGFKSLMLTGFIFQILNLPLILTALFLGKSKVLMALVIAGTIAAFLQLVLFLFAIFFEAKSYGIVLSFRQLRSLLKPVLFDFSTPAFLGKLMEQPLTWISILFLVNLGGGPFNVGGLTVITNIRTWILYLPGLVASVLIPLLTDIYHTREIKDFKQTLVLSQRFLWFSTLPGLVLVLALIRPIIELFFGRSYEVFWLSGAVFLGWAFLVPINEVNDRAMIAMGKLWLSLGFRIIYLVLVIISLLFLVPKYHLLGYVIAGGISYFVYVGIQTLWLRSVTKERLGSILVLTIFSISFLILAYYTTQLSSLSKTFLCGLTLFAVTLWLEWVYLVKLEEKALILAQLKNLSKKRFK